MDLQQADAGEETLPVAQWSGEVSLYGITVHCHVLSDGRRIIEADDLDALFGAMAAGAAMADPKAMERFARWSRGGELNGPATG